MARRAAETGARTARGDGPMLTQWESLSRALRADGLLTSADARLSEHAPMVRAIGGTGNGSTAVPVNRMARLTTPRHEQATGGTTPRSWAESLPAWWRSAAAVLLVASGVVAGRLSVGANILPLVDGFSVFASAASGEQRASARAALQRTATDRSASARAALLLDGASFGSIAQATDVLNSAQRQYEQASLWLAANDTTVRASDVYRARLAALDQMMAASRAALRDAPQDPVLNRYFLAASTARQATLQQLSGALPVDKSIEGY
jgi:hypothetical protein